MYSVEIPTRPTMVEGPKGAKGCDQARFQVFGRL